MKQSICSLKSSQYICCGNTYLTTDQQFDITSSNFVFGVEISDDFGLLAFDISGEYSVEQLWAINYIYTPNRFFNRLVVLNYVEEIRPLLLLRFELGKLY